MAKVSVLLSVLLLFGLVALVPSRAEACGPLAPVPTQALPRTGATDVSTATSLTVLSRGQPAGLTLRANGQDVPLLPPVSLGSGADGTTPGLGFWQVRAVDSLLPANAEHVLSQSTGGGSPVEVTRFTTAAGYDKAEGVAPVVRALHLWRVRYPVSDIASGNCVFAEYHGFVTIDYDPATIPNTPPSSVVHTFHLSPKNGGGEQTFVYAGDTTFAGLAPAGDYPLPLGQWQPELNPTRSYCLTITAFGDGDLARLPVTSQPVCAEVAQLSAAGAPPPPVIGGGGSGGGCAVAGDGAAGSLAQPLFLLVAVALVRRARR